MEHDQNVFLQWTDGPFIGLRPLFFTILGWVSTHYPEIRAVYNKNKSSSWTEMLLQFQLFMPAYRPFSQLIFCLIYCLDSVVVGDYEQHNEAAMWD